MLDLEKIIVTEENVDVIISLIGMAINSCHLKYSSNDPFQFVETGSEEDKFYSDVIRQLSEYKFRLITKYRS